MPETQDSISLPLLAAVLRRQVVMITAVVVIAVGLAIAFAAVSKPTYSATTTVSFNDPSGDLQALGIPAAQNFNQAAFAAANAQIITSQSVVRTVKRTLGLPQSVTALQSNISSAVQPSNNLVAITVTASTGRRAAAIANSVAQTVKTQATAQLRARYLSVAKQIRANATRLRGAQNSLAAANDDDEASRLVALASLANPVTIVTAATVPSSPSSPKPVRDAVLAGVLGLMLGIVLAFARNSFDRRLGTEGDLEGYVELPTLAMLRKAALGKTPLAPSEDRRTAAEDLESFRMLRTGLSIISAGEPAKCVLVTSPLAQEGKSSIAAGLAWAEAISGRRTLLVDCDLVHPTVAERTGLNASPGLTDYLLGNARPKDVMRLVKAGRKPDGGDASVVCIPAGTAVPNHAELLESSRFREFLQEVGSAYDCVILDSAPLLAVSDTLPLLPIVDAVIICLRLRQSTRDGAVAVSNALANFPEKPVGMVFTAADRAQGLYYSGSYAYAGARSGTAA